MNLPRTLAALVCCVGLTLGSSPAWAGDLAQVVNENEQVAEPGTEAVIDHGHVDIGAQLIDGQPHFMARDDSATTPVWRELDDVLFHLPDSAQLTLPADDDFSFVGAEPGQNVWVLPQTEQAGVPWVGWNTQAPSLTESADRGVNMQFLGHTGPGEFSLFLQNGGFEPPQLLWSTASGAHEDFWVDLNTHTHANWTFSKPGVHQVGIRLSATTTAGEKISTDGILTFAVGDATDLEQAQATQWDAKAAAESLGSASGIPGWAIGLLTAGALLLAVAVGALILAQRRTPAGENRG
ncbi:choice-of-anchor M domain-containing protein [Corynebacterium sp.]|uniref:choice-of-anchor M domain-containing protein n=1 Tax=Corynebacterium sp. TaxID=1720 RepID=UPI0026DBCE6F|nr:choice-of-anchor M domain-containing protein [Corynebacterium sp.]MDO5031482.1 choice-of-anchor M domain-containing protein [Corynebacterium sp.]